MLKVFNLVLKIANLISQVPGNLASRFKYGSSDTVDCIGFDSCTIFILACSYFKFLF